MKKYPNYSIFPYRVRKLRCLVPALLWLLGLCCGIRLSLYSDNRIISWMRSSLESPVSIVSLFGVTVFPLFLSAYAVYSSKSKLMSLASLCFFKAVIHGYSSMLLYLAFGCCGWLIRFLLLFHGCISSVILLFFISLNFQGKQQYLRGAFWLLFALDILAASAEYRIFSPALAYWIYFLRKGKWVADSCWT